MACITERHACGRLGICRVSEEKAMEKQIWDYLSGKGLPAAGIAGLMGNLYAESGLKPNNLENLCEKRLDYKYTDETYTAAVDCGAISRKEFLNPLPGKQYGYGLAQWTSPNRKAGLYDLAKQRGASIADLTTQLDWLWTELQTSYKSVLQALQTAKTVREASDAVLSRFEAPAGITESVKSYRASLGQVYYDKYAKEASSMKKRTAKDFLNIMRSWIGYCEANGKHRYIIDIYNAHKPLARGYKVQYNDAWCDTTISAAAIKAGMVDLIGTECGCEEHINIFKSKGIWIEDGKITPKAGHIIVYNWDDSVQPNDGYSDHIGVVESVKGGTITVIEGNYKDAVGRRVIPVGYGCIRGYAAPKYDTEDSVVVKTENQQTSGSVTMALNYTPKWVGKVQIPEGKNRANVRTWAGTKYPRIKSWPELAEGNLVDICDSVKASKGAEWYFIRIAGRYYGFIHSKYIKSA